jgi:tRNA G18 (ribose-2'-O)-methylase SpoU
MSTVNFSLLQKMDQHNADHNVRDQFKDWSLEERREYTKNNEGNFSVALMNITGDLNTGIIIRTAHLMGASEVLVFGRNKIDKRSTVGADKYTDITYFGGLREDLTVDPHVFTTAMTERNLCPVFVEIGGHNINEIDFKKVTRNSSRSICFVFGNEGRGIDSGIMATQDLFPNSFVVSIPQRGIMRSYNVSSAASIVLYAYNLSMGWE